MQSIIGRGTLAAGGFLVTSFRAKSRNLPCSAVIHVSVKMKIDVFVFRFPAVSRRPLWGCQKDPSAALGMTKRGADGFSLVFRSLPSIRFLRCVPLQRVRSGEECPKDCGERSSRIVAEYNRKGDISSRRLSRNVISSEVEKSSLPCGYPCQCENENRRLCVSFPCCITSAVMGLPERSLGCARDDETGSGWFLTRFQIAAIHPLPSVCPSSTSSRSRSK